MHTMRANYQYGIWRWSLQQHPQVPSPVKRGWVRNDESQLTVEWMRGSPAPEAVLLLLLCKCNRRCKLRNASVWATVWNVPTCASCKHVTINPRRRTITGWSRRPTWLTLKRTTEMEESSSDPSHNTDWSFVIHVLCDLRTSSVNLKCAFKICFVLARKGWARRHTWMTLKQTAEMAGLSHFQRLIWWFVLLIRCDVTNKLVSCI